MQKNKSKDAIRKTNIAIWDFWRIIKFLTAYAAGKKHGFSEKLIKNEVGFIKFFNFDFSFFCIFFRQKGIKNGFFICQVIFEKNIQISQVCAKVRIFQRKKIFQKSSWQKVFHRQNFLFPHRKALICLKKRYFYTVTTRFSTTHGENVKKAWRILSDIQSAQKRLWKKQTEDVFFWFLFDFAGVMWYN